MVIEACCAALVEDAKTNALLGAKAAPVDTAAVGDGTVSLYANVCVAKSGPFSKIFAV
jgi:hypothetical protein